MNGFIQCMGLNSGNPLNTPMAPDRHQLNPTRGLPSPDRQTSFICPPPSPISKYATEDYHDIKVMKERYQGRWDSNLMADYCWALMRDIPEAVYQRSSKNTFMQLYIA